MRICFFFEGLKPGGIERMLANFTYEMQDRGYNFTLILTGSPTSQDYAIASDTEVKWLRHPTNSARGSIPSLVRELRKGDYDILISAMPEFNNAAVLARILSGTKTKNLLTERTSPYPDYALRSPKQKIWHRAAAIFYPRAAAIVAVSRGLADSLARFARLDRSKIDVIYNPAYRPLNDADRTGQIHPWLTDGAGPVVVTAGRLATQKDFPTFLRAIKKVKISRPDVRAIVLGDGDLRGELEAMAVNLGIADAIAFPGFVPDIRESLSASRLFVLSSAWEGFGNVLVEALGAGCSIVSTSCPDGPAEILSDGDFGILVNVGDDDAMADGIIRIIEQPSDPQDQINRAKQFSVVHAFTQYEAIFRRITAK
ncbi:glycosyltransferase [Sphingomonas sp. VNH70]|uniref:glycosyltransferase n=1 Tax=Sphingomonas silueang TaxID=3156617 RepID=UPI0032B4BBB1